MKRVVVALGVVFCAGASASAGFVTVPGTANIFGAGHAVPPAPDGGGGGTLPIEVALSEPAAGSWMEFPTVDGSVSCCNGIGGSFNGPDGGVFASGNTDVLSFNGISGMVNGDATMFLVGVFVGPGTPMDPAPDRLDFTGGMDFDSISPMLNQSFFIGDGRRGDSSLQRFLVPSGATRLFFGFVDAFEFGEPTNLPGFYDDNLGAFRVDPVQVPGAPVAAGMMMFAVGSSRRRR